MARCFAMLVLLALAFIGVPAAADDRPAYVLGAGRKGGSFSEVSRLLDQQLRRDHAEMRIAIRETAGSCENIKHLLRGDVSFALVQHDVAAEAMLALSVHRDPQAGPYQTTAPAGSRRSTMGYLCSLDDGDLAEQRELRLVAAVSESAVHVLVQRPLLLTDFAQLRGRSVYLGEVGSGSFETAKVIVGAAGLMLADLAVRDGRRQDAFRALQDGELAMMLRTVEPGDEGIKQVVEDGWVTVNPLPPTVLDQIIDNYPHYRLCQIEARTYRTMSVAVQTVCVSDVLLTNLPADDEHGNAAVSELLAALAGAARTKQGAELGLALRFENFSESTNLALHPVAERAAHAERLRDFGLHAFAALLAASALWLGRRLLLRRGARKHFRELTSELRHNPLYPLFGLMLVITASTALVWSLEHESNSRVRTLPDAFWEMSMFATGGFSTESIKTSGARAVGVLATLGGMGVLAWFTAALTSLFAQDQLRLWRPLREHIVILNFREEMLHLVRQLRSSGLARTRPIHVVVADDLPRRVRASLAALRNVSIYHSNPEDPEDLRQLRLARAQRIAVLRGDRRHAARFHPMRVTRAIDHALRFPELEHAAELQAGAPGVSIPPRAPRPLLAGERRGAARLVRVLQRLRALAQHLRAPVRARMRPAAAAAPATFVECPGDELRGLFDPFKDWLVPLRERQLADDWITTAVVDPSFASVYDQLACYRADSAEVYAAPVPRSFRGRTWGELRRALIEVDDAFGVIPVALYTAGLGGSSRTFSEQLLAGLVLNPSNQTPLQKTDRVIALAESERHLLTCVRATGRRELRARLLSRLVGPRQPPAPDEPLLGEDGAAE